MNLLDAVAVLLLVVAVILGIRSGAVPQLLGLTGAALSAIAGIAILPVFAPLLDDLSPVLRAVIVLSVLLGLVGIGEAIGATIGREVSRRLGSGLLGALDRAGGAIVGAAQSILILWLAGGVIASGPFPTLSQIAQRSTALRAVDALLPPPTEIVLQLGQVFDDAGLPNVFIGLEQLPAPAIDLPSDEVAREIGERAAPSVLRVIADGCRNRASGSSFAVGPGYLVTNAHVIAGADSVIVQTSNDSFVATPVLVDFELDIAVLWAAGVDVPALQFTTEEPGRGAIGATVGFPGGRDKTVERATVAATYVATGLDVTRTGRVQRRIIELRAQVVPGDSGGPFVLQDGTVGGVVFAESRVDPNVGYALSPLAVQGRVAPAIGAWAPASTGPCLD